MSLHRHKNAYERAVVYPSVGSIVGAWLGAIPIALDWDRPWQASTPQSLRV